MQQIQFSLTLSVTNFEKFSTASSDIKTAFGWKIAN